MCKLFPTDALTHKWGGKQFVSVKTLLEWYVAIHEMKCKKYWDSRAMMCGGIIIGWKESPSDNDAVRPKRSLSDLRRKQE